MKKASVRWMTFGAMGFEVALCVVIGILLGVWADDRFGMQPFGVLGGTVCGMAAALQRLFRYLRLMKDIDDTRGDEQG